MAKVIYFDKYVPYTLTKDEEGNRHESQLSLNTLFSHIKENQLGNSFRDIYGAKYRFHVCEYHEEDKVWELQILHLRDSVLPGIADESDEFNLIELPEGRYPAESCTALYSIKNNMIYLQRNVACISSKRLTRYLHSLLPEQTKMLLKPVIKGNRFSKVSEQAVYKKVILTCYNDPHRQDDASSLGEILKTVGKYNAPTVHVEIGLGRKRGGKLNAAETTKLLREAYEDEDIQMLKVHLAPRQDEDFELVDLLEDRDCYILNIEFSRENPISHARLYSYCEEAYRNNP